MAWHHAVTWEPERDRDLLNIVLLSHALQTDSAARILWQRAHASLAFFRGQQIARTLAYYGPLTVQVWGPDPDISSFAEETMLDEFVQAIRAAPPPDNRIQALVYQSDQSSGLSFMRPRCQIDQYILERTIGADTIAGLETRLPSAIHLAAALGSPEAYNVASQMGYGAYTDYFDQVRIELESLPDEEWTAELFWNWLYTYRLLIQDKNLSYPKWMRTRAWRRRELQTMLGSWTDVRASASYTVVQPAEAEQGEIAAPWGYIEPQPQVYGHLAATIQMTIDELDRRLMLSGPERSMLDEWKTWLVLFQDVARRELTGQTLTNLEYERLIDYATVIAQMTATALGDLVPAGDSETEVEHHVAAITDIAASQENLLWEGIGEIDEIYVVVERGQQRFLTRGGVYSYYEFEWPIQSPFDEELWMQMLADDRAPPRLEWITEFVIPQDTETNE
jgi:hypothetical protein